MSGPAQTPGAPQAPGYQGPAPTPPAPTHATATAATGQSGSSGGPMSNQNLNQIVSHFLLVCLMNLHGRLIPLHHQHNGDHYIICPLALSMTTHIKHRPYCTLAPCILSRVLISTSLHLEPQ